MFENETRLTDHGNESIREPLLTVCEYALRRVHPSVSVENAVSSVDGTLSVDGVEYDLDAVDDVYVIAAGKGSSAAAETLQRILGDDLTAGIVVEKHGQKRDVSGVEVLEASHPIPDETGSDAARKVTALADEAGENDVVFACITGGASAQLVSPPEGVTVDELATLTRLLLNAGVRIDEVNAVRKHVSDIKGGQLRESIEPATPITLVLVDEVAGEPWGPTAPDETTYHDAIRVLRRHDLWEETPRSIRTHLRRGANGEIPETPSEIRQETGRTVVLADATDVCEAACGKARELGYNSTILSSVIEGESQDVGIVLASIGKEISRSDRPIETPCILVSGGETTVSLDDDGGRGGPNQELAVRVATEIDRITDVGLLAIGTDGTDGPTDIAGGLVDDRTAGRAREQNVDLFDHLARHDTSPALESLSDAVYTGATGTNVMDLRLLIVE
ncbi:glycerate kinase type-2 family protein [Salinirarus marinus]|uniref:glycerate kinase type-2 family protein n=1 Tax=Salinirarus marinus TaxID=3068310 RepID=UPI003C6BDBB8